MAFRDNKAKMRSGPADPVEVLKPTNSKESNQVQFTTQSGRPARVGPAQGKAQIGANTKGTGTEKVPTAIALSGKRKKNLQLPANY